MKQQFTFGKKTDSLHDSILSPTETSMSMIMTKTASNTATTTNKNIGSNLTSALRKHQHKRSHSTPHDIETALAYSSVSWSLTSEQWSLVALAEVSTDLKPKVIGEDCGCRLFELFMRHEKDNKFIVDRVVK